MSRAIRVNRFGGSLGSSSASRETGGEIPLKKSVAHALIAFRKVFQRHAMLSRGKSNRVADVSSVSLLQGVTLNHGAGRYFTVALTSRDYDCRRGAGRLAVSR